MNADITQLRREISAAVERLFSGGGHAIASTAARAREVNPPFLLSVARGSSDHACTCLKHAGELVLKRPLASVGPSVASQCGVELDTSGAMCMSISQSGQGPGIVQMTKAFRAGGALTIGITNNPASGLADGVGRALPVHAGSELSVAATKTLVISLAAGLWLIAEVKAHASLLSAIRAMPDHIEAGTRCDSSPAADVIVGQSLFALGRGPSWAISNETALKFKDSCLMHAESCSSAEVCRGPVAVVDHGFPVIAFAADDAAEDSSAETADAVVDKGGQVFAVTDKVKRAARLQHARTDHWLTDPIAAIVSFYGMVEAVALRRGIDPGALRHLDKVTETT
ncbi:MAG: SIS domain-containing protein [Boseongicola sp. SB0667_bin_21]|nr:SIS domain-containing protein [Boseongicola sp. SB0667_bin_21]